MNSSSSILSSDNSCVIRVHAELVSLGGGIVLTICLLLTGILLIAFTLPSVTSIQRLISGIFFIAGWLYLWKSATEELFFEHKKLFFTSTLGRTHEIELDEIESVLLVHEGLNLEQGIETLEIRFRDRPPEQFSLGPCWQRNKLEKFLHALEEILHMPKVLEEVR